MVATCVPMSASSHTLRRIAVEANADPRSVRKELLCPGSVRGMAGQRIREALARASASERADAMDLSSAGDLLDVEQLRRAGLSDERIKAAIEALRGGGGSRAED